MENKNVKRFICIFMAVVIFVSAPIVSYNESRAASVVAGVALGDLLFDLILSAGVTYLGYTSIKQLEKDTGALASLKEALLSNPVVARAIDDARRIQDTDGGTAVLNPDSKYDSPAGYRYRYIVNLSSGGGEPPSGEEPPSGGGSSGGKGLFIGLGAALLAAVVSAVKKWADGEDNEFEELVSPFQAGTTTIGSNTLRTYVYGLSDIGSVSGIDSFFGYDGLSDYLVSQGYSDSTHYFLINDLGSSIRFYYVPLSSLLCGYKTYYSSSGYTFIISSASYLSFLRRLENENVFSLDDYFRKLPSAPLKYLSYNPSAGTWSSGSTTSDISLFNYVSGYGNNIYRPNLGGYYVCNYQKACSEGGFISAHQIYQDFYRFVFSSKALSKRLLYDPAKAPAIPSNGVDFSIPESNYQGFDWTDLSSLVSHVSSLSSKLDESLGNQEEIIDQNRSILDALNNMQPLIRTIADNTGRAAALLEPIKTGIETLPEKMAQALNETLPEKMAQALAEMLPEKMAEALSTVTITPPEVVIPEIKVPEIVLPKIEIPEIKPPNVNVTYNPPAVTVNPPAVTVNPPAVTVNPPDITLNPNYNITVQNNYTGLEGIISRAVEGVLTKLFVPDQDAALQKVGDMKGYFVFTDEVGDSVKELKTFLFGIAPSPVLKIPIGNVSSDRYNYGFGDYITIDVSWYSRYKQFGDKVILAVVWALFLWRLFLKLPGIISGAEGSIMSANNSYQKFSGRE